MAPHEWPMRRIGAAFENERPIPIQIVDGIVAAEFPPRERGAIVPTPLVVEDHLVLVGQSTQWQEVPVIQARTAVDDDDGRSFWAPVDLEGAAGSRSRSEPGVFRRIPSCAGMEAGSVVSVNQANAPMHPSSTVVTSTSAAPQ